MEQPTEAQLLAKVEEIYRLRLLEFRRVAAAISGDRPAAPDIVQEGFVRAVGQLPSFRREGSLEGWVWRIVVNVAKNHRRDLRPTDELPTEIPQLANGSSHSESGAMAAALGVLPERQRLVLFLRFYADLEYGAIAQALEISPGTVGPTLTAARTALQQLLFKAEAANER